LNLERPVSQASKLDSFVKIRTLSDVQRVPWRWGFTIQGGVAAQLFYNANGPYCFSLRRS